jgi:hypothetical protein
MNHFAMVTEGESDQAVIDAILSGFFDDFDLVTTINHPLRDVTDKGRATGGWGNLREYCKSQAFQKIFQTSRYVVIQIDTDVSEEFGVTQRHEGAEISLEMLIERTISKIIEWIGPEFYTLVQDRILFAIAVHQIECWLLPIYFTDKKRSKTTNCIDTLNQVLPQREGFSIHAKEYCYYEKMSKHFLKRKQLLQYVPRNPSLHTFVQQLETCHL